MVPFALLLAPGAGAGRDQEGLVAIDRQVAAMGGLTRRMDFPYRLAGRRAPDRPEVLVAAVRREAEALWAAPGPGAGLTYLGGRSMGARMCSMAVAEGLPAAGLVMVSYPLHPPGRPESLRTAHFGRLDVPCLFVSGSRDAFATAEELERETAAIPGPVEVHVLDGGDHGLARREGVVAGVVADWLGRQVAPGSPARPSEAAARAGEIRRS